VFGHFAVKHVVIILINVILKVVVFYGVTNNIGVVPIKIVPKNYGLNLKQWTEI
jgi:hypothetical protein